MIQGSGRGLLRIKVLMKNTIKNPRPSIFSIMPPEWRLSTVLQKFIQSDKEIYDSLSNEM